jgi:signal peptidase I
MKKSIVREYFESLVVAVILALFVRTWVFQAFKIPTGSMEPNLLVGDHLIVNKMRFAPIKRGDVIVFKFPKDPERDFVKRVIGLPGDRIELHRKKVFVNGQPIDEPYAHFIEPPSSPDTAPKVDDVREEYGPVNVPTDQYFMMGDNRDNSEDSRYWGFMPRSYVKGKALFIYFSLGDMGVRWSRMLHMIH